MWLADTSAWHRSMTPAVLEPWIERMLRDQIATTPPVRLEVLFSARSARDYTITSRRLDALRQVPCGEDAQQRGLEVQRLLADEHDLHHRSVKVVDLMIAAAAELAGVTVWHYDEDYDRIAALTGQPTEWIAPRGSL